MPTPAGSLRALGLAGALGIGVHPDPRRRHPRRRLGRAGAAGGGAARRAGGDLRRACRRVRALLDPRGVRRVPVRARLHGPGALPGERGLSGAAVRNVALDLDDRSPPTPSFTGGSLFASDAVRGDQTVALRAADEGGGVRRLELRVNGELVRDDVRDCQLSAGIATALQPCAPEALATATLATSAPPFATGLQPGQGLRLGPRCERQRAEWRLRECRSCSSTTFARAPASPPARI